MVSGEHNCWHVDTARPQRASESARAAGGLRLLLAAGAVGYSPLMEAGEAGTRAAQMGRLRDVLDLLVARYQGRIPKARGEAGSGR